MVAELKLLDKLVDLLMGNPTPQQIIAFNATDEENERVSYLLDRNRNAQLTYEERRELDRFLDANRLISKAKVNAFVQLNGKLN